MNPQDWIVPEKDRVPYLQTIALIAKADGVVTSQEKAFVESVMKSWKLSVADKKIVRNVLKNGGDLEKIVKRMKNTKTRYLLLQDLVSIGYVDGDYSKDEKIAIRMIADICEISRKRVSEIERWVKQGIAWREKGSQLLSPE